MCIRDSRAEDPRFFAIPVAEYRKDMSELKPSKRAQHRRRLSLIHIFAAYSYMSLVPLIQPPIMNLFTSKAARSIKMDQLRTVTRFEPVSYTHLDVYKRQRYDPPGS